MASTDETICSDRAAYDEYILVIRMKVANESEFGKNNSRNHEKIIS